MYPLWLLWLVLFSAADFSANPQTIEHNCALHQAPIMNSFPAIDENTIRELFGQHPEYAIDGYDFPVGIPNAEGYYLSQRFGQKNHLGEDWNGNGGGNTDLGDPVYSVANGLVTFVGDLCCGWGKVVRICHYDPTSKENSYVESVYAHMNEVYLSEGQMVNRGTSLGTIGTANGKWTAHLHLEIRDFINMALGPGYSEDHFGFVDPSNFISERRPAQFGR